MIGYRQIQQHYIQQHKGKSFKCIILHATGTQQPLEAALGRHVTLKYEAATYLCVYNPCAGSLASQHQCTIYAVENCSFLVLCVGCECPYKLLVSGLWHLGI